MKGPNNSTEARYKALAQYFAQTRDKTRALKMAGYTDSYAKARGYKIFEKEQVKQYVAEYMEQLKERNNLTVDWVIDQFQKIATVEITDVVNVETRHREVDGREIPYQIVTVKDTADLTPEQRLAIKTIKQTQHGITVELYSKDVVLNKLGEYLGIWKQNINLSGKVEGSNPFESLTPDELRKLIGSKGSG